MADLWKTVLISSQCSKCVDKCGGVSWTLATRLRNYRLWCFRIFTQVVVMLDEYPKLSAKWRISGKYVPGFAQYQKCVDKGSWVSLVLVTWLRSYNLFFILEVSLSLTWRRRSALNHQKNGFLENRFRHWPMLEVYR